MSLTMQGVLSFAYAKLKRQGRRAYGKDPNTLAGICKYLVTEGPNKGDRCAIGHFATKDEIQVLKDIFCNFEKLTGDQVPEVLREFVNDHPEDGEVFLIDIQRAHDEAEDDLSDLLERFNQVARRWDLKEIQ